jgi:hypothetical protein
MKRGVTKPAEQEPDPENQKTTRDDQLDCMRFPNGQAHIAITIGDLSDLSSAHVLEL